MITNLIRLLDILVIGPINVLFAFTVKEKWLALVTLVIGILTILYNFVNLCTFHFGIRFDLVLPKWLKKLFWHDTNGKTQFLRLINLTIMYPLLILAYLKSYPGNWMMQFTKYTMLFFIISGFIYNLENFLILMN